MCFNGSIVIEWQKAIHSRCLACCAKMFHTNRTGSVISWKPAKIPSSRQNKTRSTMMMTTTTMTISNKSKIIKHFDGSPIFLFETNKLSNEWIQNDRPHRFFVVVVLFGGNVNAIIVWLSSSSSSSIESLIKRNYCNLRRKGGFLMII